MLDRSGFTGTTKPGECDEHWQSLRELLNAEDAIQGTQGLLRECTGDIRRRDVDDLDHLLAAAVTLRPWIEFTEMHQVVYSEGPIISTPQIMGLSPLKNGLEEFRPALELVGGGFHRRRTIPTLKPRLCVG